MGVDLAPGPARAYCKGMQPPGLLYRPGWLSEDEEVRLQTRYSITFRTLRRKAD